MPVSLSEDAEMLSPAPQRPPVLLNEKFVVHSYDGGSQQNRAQYDVKNVLIPTLEPFHCSDRGSKFSLVLKCSEDFTLTHFYISGPGPRCTEPIRSGLVWVCDRLPHDLNNSLAMHCADDEQLLEEERQIASTGASDDELLMPCARFFTDAESRDVEIELSRWREGRFVIVRLLDTHYMEEQVNVDVGMICLAGYAGRCARHQVPLGPWMWRRVQQAWVHSRPLQRTFSAGGWVCDGRDFTGGCRNNFLDFHQTSIYTSRYHCSSTGFDLCDACANDPNLGKVTETSVKVDIEALQNTSTCKLVTNRLRNQWRRHWLHALPMYFRQGLLKALTASLQSCLDNIAARRSEEEAGTPRSRSTLVRSASKAPDPQLPAAMRSMFQLATDIVQGILLGARPGCDVQVNDLVWVLSTHGADAAADHWERCRVVRLPPSFPSAGSPTVRGPLFGQVEVQPEDEDEATRGDLASAFVVSSRDWKGQRHVQACNVWKVTKALNDEEVMTATTGLYCEISRGPYCDVDRVRHLLGRSADLSAANAEGQTALHAAANNRCPPDVFSLLLKAKACPDQSDRHGATALQLLERVAPERSSIEFETMLLRSHGATEASTAGASTEEALSFLRESLSKELLGPLLALRCGNGHAPPAEALEAVMVLLRKLPGKSLRSTLMAPTICVDGSRSQSASVALQSIFQSAVEGTSGPSAALQCLRIANILKLRAQEEPQLLSVVLRHGLYHWAQRLISMKDPLQAGVFGSALQHERQVSLEELLREARELCSGSSSQLEAETGLCHEHFGLTGVRCAFEKASAEPGAARAAFCAARDLLLQPVGSSTCCTAFEFKTCNLAGLILRLLGPHRGTSLTESSSWAAFQDAFGFGKAASIKLLQSLQSVVNLGDFPTWRHKKERGLKALTEPVQLRLESWTVQPGELREFRQQDKQLVSIMVEPLVPLQTILHYLLRVSPVASESYLSFCHNLVGCTLRDKASGESGEVLSFELLLTDCPLPVHCIRLPCGETRKQLLSMCDFEYSASARREDRTMLINFRVALSLLHMAGGTGGYSSSLDDLEARIQNAREADTPSASPSTCATLSDLLGHHGQTLAKESGNWDESAGLPAAKAPRIKQETEDDAESNACADGTFSKRPRLRWHAQAGRSPRGGNNPAVEAALKQAVEAARLCQPEALQVLAAERARLVQASAKASAAAGEANAQAASNVDPSCRVHSVTLTLPEEIPLDVFWPMVQEDIMTAVQEFYPRGVPPHVQETLQTGEPKDGAIPVAQRLPLEEAETLAARLSHLAQTAVVVDARAVQEMRRLGQQHSASEPQESPREGRWPPQLAPRSGAARQTAVPRAPAVAARVRLQTAPDSEDWISGVVVGYGLPDAPWRGRNGPVPAEACLDVVDDQGILWEHLPPGRVKLPVVQKGSGGQNEMRGAERGPGDVAHRPSIDRFRYRPFDPVPPRMQPPQLLLQPLQLPQPPPPPLTPPPVHEEAPAPDIALRGPSSPATIFWPTQGGREVAPDPGEEVAAAALRWHEAEEVVPPLIPASAEPEEDQRRRRGRRRRRSRSKSRSRSRSQSRSRARARQAREAQGRGEQPAVVKPVQSEMSSEASGAHREHAIPASSASQQAEDSQAGKQHEPSPSSATGTSSQLSPGSKGSAEEEQPAASVRSPRIKAKGVLLDVLRGDLPSFTRAADTQDPTTLLGHPIMMRLAAGDLEEEDVHEEAVSFKKAECWLAPPKFQVRLSLSKKVFNEHSWPSVLPPDWSLLKTMQCLQEWESSQNLADTGVQATGIDKVQLDNFHLAFLLEPVDLDLTSSTQSTHVPNSQDAILDLDSFALPPAAEHCETPTFAPAPEPNLSLPHALSPSSSSPPKSSWIASPRCTPQLSPASIAGRKRRRAASSPLLTAESPSCVPRDLYRSPVLGPSGGGRRPASNDSPQTEVSILLRQCVANSSGQAAVVDALELLNLLWVACPGGQCSKELSSHWLSKRLDWKLRHQLEDPLSISSGALPLWATTLPRICPFLFSLETRKMLLRYTAFGPSVALHWVQESKVGSYLRRRQALPTELSVAAQSDQQKVEELLQEASNVEESVIRSEHWLGALQSTLLRLQRGSGKSEAHSCENMDIEEGPDDQADEALLQQAEGAMELTAASGRMLEVQFDSETGFGNAVTRSFYGEVARALQGRAANRRVPMWVEDDMGSGSSTSSGAGIMAGQHLRCRRSLFVRPLQPGPIREAVQRRFRFLGRLVGRAMKDGFIVPLPLSEAFFARAVLGTNPAPGKSPLDDDGPCGAVALPRPGAGCVGELCGALADFARELRLGEAHLRRQRDEAGRCPLSAKELQEWRQEQGNRPDFVQRFLKTGGNCQGGMSFNCYLSLVGVSFLETGLSGVPLCHGGADRAVTVENLDEFVELAARFWLDTGITAQLQAFRDGLNEVLPVECLEAFTACELRDMICGEDSIEWDERELLDHLHPSGGLTEQSPAYQHLVATLVEMDQGNRSRFLEFVSSCPRLPPGGISSFHVDVFPDSGPGGGFPRSRACANQLYLPAYSSKEILRDRLHEAMHCSAGHHEQEQPIRVS